MTTQCRVGVLVSGNGSNLQAILEAAAQPHYPAEVVVVISNVPGVRALERARVHKIDAVTIRHEDYPDRTSFEDALCDTLAKRNVQLVALAGFMRILSPHFIRRYPQRILNIHPALLPAFPGTHAIGQAWDHGVKVTGVTVHFVDEGTDTGPIVLQEAIPVRGCRTIQELEERIHSVEHHLYPEAIRLFAEGRLSVKKRKVEEKI